MTQQVLAPAVPDPADREGAPRGRRAAGGTPVDGVRVVGALSPSRAADFMTCPLLYRFRVVDRLPEPSSPAALRGTLVHKVLEELFDVAAPDRTPERAAAMLEPAWAALAAEDPELAALFEGEPDVEGWLRSCEESLRAYFALEDPRRLEPAGREMYVETVLESRLLLRGVVDRLDVAPTGEVRVVDYKTGRSPGPLFEAKALFQMKFYALVLWRLSGRIPTLLQLIYLGNGEVLRYAPDEAELRATERKVEAIWKAIARAAETGDWRHRPSALCGWCAHQSLCPAFGGTPPALPGTAVADVVDPGLSPEDVD